MNNPVVMIAIASVALIASVWIVTLIHCKVKVYKALCGCWFLELGNLWTCLWHSDKCRCGQCGEKECVCK